MTTAALDLNHLAFFVPVKLEAVKNARDAHWSARAKRAKLHRDATTYAVLQALGSDRTAAWKIEAKPSTPKRIHLSAAVYNMFDSHDGLRAACSHIVDGLVDAGLIQDDADRAGHEFSYSQRIDREHLGVLVTVTMA
jgi:hypothetical protein